ncbi:hypothetical protein KI387_008716 [Taxus chinensis]|uniref:Uncharacterized protein n=1 Tax=Taxus chinensis TaxID=29808 RepID=A0AA38CU44_TAXCH|nr:hypothetical protein KI387_008716 [Taxus chinensis]
MISPPNVSECDGSVDFGVSNILLDFTNGGGINSAFIKKRPLALKLSKGAIHNFTDLPMLGAIHPHNSTKYERESINEDTVDSHALSGLFKSLLRSPLHTHFFFLKKMGGQLKRIEPASCSSIKEDEEVWNILVDNGISTFLERMTGYSALVSYTAMATWARGRVQIGKTTFTISTNGIADATGLPAAGDIYTKRLLQAKIQDFITPEERLVKNLSGYTRESLPPPWDRLAEVIMRYFTIDSRYRLIFGPHLFILSHLRWGKRINLVAFLFQSLEHSIQLARDGDGAILHQGLLYLLFTTAASHSELVRFPPKSEDVDLSNKALSPVSSPNESLAEDLLGLAKLYPNSPGSEQTKTNLQVDNTSTQNVGEDSNSTDSATHANSPKSPPFMDENPAEPTVADSSRDEHRIEIVSSILDKLQHAFTTLKAWEDFTDSTRKAIVRDCADLITLAEKLTEDSGSPSAKHVVAELKKLI